MRELLRSSSMLDRLGPRDRALAVRIALGVTSTSGTLDVLINAHLHHGAHLEPRVRDAMRISCYEICWLQTPDAVAVAGACALSGSARSRLGQCGASPHKRR
jgi:16S rRNA (cytosine967-C5)-methyltransferase